MKIAIYGKKFNESFNDAIYKIFEKLNKNKVEIFVYKRLLFFIKEQLFFSPKINGQFNDHSDLPADIDLVFSIGGDGTFLECVSLVRKKEIPIVGINCGHLGFLAYISKDEISSAIDNIIKKDYTIEKRVLIEVCTENNLFGDFNFALNELTVHKKDTSSMITIDVYMNDDFLNKYWADGLIISTPTGSTAYSLSAGGPIVVPGSGNFVITPIAPHNLTVRPIVLSDNNTLKLIVKGRSQDFLATLDYRSEIFDSSIELLVKKAEFNINMIKLPKSNFFSTLRNKLMWGLDKRN
jgi:NAD+ kinase